jgi:GNAT superfamily N-acetyltransferase
MSAYDLELLSTDHDRKGFRCGRESLEIYLRETARSHLTKGIGITRVLVENNATAPKPILGYFTLTTILIEASAWPGAAKGLPALPIPVILLGRLAVAATWQRKGIAALLLAAARQISAASLHGTGGIGLAVDAAEEELVPFYQKYGFRRIRPSPLRLFLPTESL